MFIRSWRKDNGSLTGGYIGVFIAVIASFFVVPLFMDSFYAHLGMQTCFLLIVFSTVLALDHSRWMWISASTLIIPFVLADTYSVINDSFPFMVLAYSFYCAFLAFAIAILLYKVITHSFIDTNLIFGAITIYLMAGILWGKLYFIVEVLIPSSFHGLKPVNLWSSSLGEGYDNQYNLMYYSFTIISTLGLGDIIPLKHLPKSLTVLESMFGQLYVATVIAKLVSVWQKRDHSHKG